MSRQPAAVRRQELVDAAIRVALAEGLEAATVRRIAAEAGVSLGTVHYVFGSKEALLEAVVESVAQPDFDVDLSGVDTTDGVAMVRAALHAYWDISGSNSQRQRLVYELVTHLVRQEDPGPELARKMMRNAAAAVLKFVHAQTDAMGLALPVPPEVVARLTVAVTDGVALGWIADQDDDMAVQVLDAYALVLGSMANMLVAPSEG